MEKLICPICKQPIRLNYYEYGIPPFHAHCYTGDINFGFNMCSIEKQQRILNEHARPHSYMEYYKRQPMLYIV